MTKKQIVKEIKKIFDSVNEDYFKGDFEYSYFENRSLLEAEELKTYRKKDLLLDLKEIQKIQNRVLSDAVVFYGYRGRKHMRHATAVIKIDEEIKAFLQKIENDKKFSTKLLIERLGNLFGLRRLNHRSMIHFAFKKQYIEDNKTNLEDYKALSLKIKKEISCVS